MVNLISDIDYKFKFHFYFVKTKKFTIMYVFFLCLIKLDFLLEASLLRYFASNLSSNNYQIQSENIEIKKFKMNKKEMQKFYNSLKRMIKISRNMIVHIENLEFARNNDFCKYSLPVLAELIHIITKSRKNAENEFICEYELYKLCELYYHSLFYIMKQNETIQFNFFQFSTEKILPLLDDILEKLDEYKFYVSYYLYSKNFFQIQNTKDEQRCHSLKKFLVLFLENKNVGISIDQIDENYGVDDLICICINIFSRFCICNRRCEKDFCREFALQEYPISKFFIHSLFANGILTGFTLQGRFEIAKFSRDMNCIHFENYLVERHMIPPIFDVLNITCALFGLPDIGLLIDE